ncbi:MAG: DUF4397 domain-containing protein [Ginsengibacter sp.]
MNKNDLILVTLMLCSIVFFISCKKEVKNIYQVQPVDSSHISITNLSPSISNLKFYLNNKLSSLPDSPVSFGKTAYVTFIKNVDTYSPDTLLLPYINLTSGYQKLGFGSYNNNDLLSEINNNFEPETNYSFFLIDTIVHGKVTSVLLKDNIRKMDANKSQIRFLNLSPDAPPLDVWAYPNAGYTGYKLFSACAYIPNDFNSFLNAESFTDIDAGTYYFEATLAGTTNLVLAGFLAIPAQDVVTIYTKGYLQGAGTNTIDVGVIQYLPQ